MEAALQTPPLPTKADFHRAIAQRGDAWYAACLRITRSPDLAQDAVQDALLSAWHKREQFEASSRLETWIHRIAVNAALQLLRKQRPERSEPLDTDPPDDTVAPHVIHADAELEAGLADALERLTETERVCFVLRHLEQWRIREIAAERGVTDGTVKQAIFRAVKKLRVSMANLKRERHA